MTPRYAYGIGALLALVVLFVVIVLAVAGAALTRNLELGLLAALALAILLGGWKGEAP